MEAICNLGCKKKFTIKKDFIPKQINFENYIENYYECPLCKFKYHISWENTETLKILGEMSKSKSKHYSVLVNKRLKLLKELEEEIKNKGIKNIQERK